MRKPTSTFPTKSPGGLSGPLFAVAILILCGAGLYVVGFVFSETHGPGTHEDWRKSMRAVTFVAGGPVCFLVSCVMAVTAVAGGRKMLAWISLLFAISGFTIVAVLAAFGCSAVDGSLR